MARNGSDGSKWQKIPNFFVGAPTSSKNKKMSISKLNFVWWFLRNLCHHEISKSKEKLKNAIYILFTSNVLIIER